MESTLLSTILNRMNRWQAIASVEDTFKVRDLDEAIRTIRRETQLPWTLKKGSLRVFHGVLEYPIASDHDELAYLDYSKNRTYVYRFRGRYTSLQQFYEDAENRNMMAEIWDEGTKYLGIRDKTGNKVSRQVSDAEDASKYSFSGDITAVNDDTVIFKNGNQSVRFSVTNNTGVATLVNTFLSFSDTNYKNKYYFRWVYLDAVPTSIELQLRTNSNNYLYKSGITTQFSGQALKAGQWNLVAFDLNEALEQGTFDSTSIASEAIILNGAATGEYRVDTSNLRQWELFDYWYYSTYHIKTVGSTVANQDFFRDSNEIYELDSELIGDLEWADVIMYTAITMSIVDVENSKLFSYFESRRQAAWEALYEQYPSMRPLITTKRWNFGSQYDGYYDFFIYGYYDI